MADKKTTTKRVTKQPSAKRVAPSSKTSTNAPPHKRVQTAEGKKRSRMRGQGPADLPPKGKK